MIEPHQRKWLKSYFQPLPKQVLATLFWGLGLLVFFPVGILPLGILGLVTIAASGGYLLRWNRKPADWQIDQQLQADLDSLQTHAFNKTGLDESDLLQPASLLLGPDFGQAKGTRWGVKTGKDGKLRFTPIALTLLYFTPDQLVIYQGRFDLFSGNLLQETTREYFYSEIVSLETRSNSLRPRPLRPGGPRPDPASETLILTTRAGNCLEIVLRNPVQTALGLPATASESLEPIVQFLRKMVREHRTADYPWPR